MAAEDIRNMSDAEIFSLTQNLKDEQIAAHVRSHSDLLARCVNFVPKLAPRSPDGPSDSASI